MSSGEGITWQDFGQPNYAEVGKWFRLFPAEFRNNLNRSEEETLIWTIFYTWHSGHRAGRATNYASFSQERVGEKFGRSRWTTARALAKLEECGLIRRLHRRPLPGQVWQTNLYFLTSKLLSLLTGVLRLKPRKSPCSTSAPQVFKKNNITPDFSATADAVAEVRPKEGVTEDGRAMVARFFGRIASTLSL